MALRPSDAAVARLLRYTEILERRAIPEGYLGPNEADRILPRHVFEACALAIHLPDEGLLIDVGSGAGLPGIPLACLRSGRTTLLESNERRAAFLRGLVAELELDETSVLVGRAEDLARGDLDLRETFAGVTCRALAQPAVALELCLPFVTVGGTFAWPLTPPRATDATASDAHAATGSAKDDDPGVGEPAGASSGSSWDFETVTRVSEELGGGDPVLVPLEVPGADAARWVMIVVKLKPTPPRYPRRTGVPARRPLG